MMTPAERSFKLRRWELILLELYKSESSFQAKVARDINSTYGYVTAVVKELERKKIIIKEPESKRLKIIKLTKNGKILTEHLIKLRELLK